MTILSRPPLMTFVVILHYQRFVWEESWLHHWRSKRQYNDHFIKTSTDDLCGDITLPKGAKVCLRGIMTASLTPVSLIRMLHHRSRTPLVFYNHRMKKSNGRNLCLSLCLFMEVLERRASLCWSNSVCVYQKSGRSPYQLLQALFDLGWALLYCYTPSKQLLYSRF